MHVSIVMDRVENCDGMRRRGGSGCGLIGKCKWSEVARRVERCVCYKPPSVSAEREAVLRNPVKVAKVGYRRFVKPFLFEGSHDN